MTEDFMARRLAELVYSRGAELAKRILAAADEDVDGVVRAAGYQDLSLAATYAAIHDHLDVSISIAHEEGRRQGVDEATKGIAA